MKEGIAAGAVGFSINRFAGHRDTSGVLVPGTLADVDEILMIGKAVAEVPIAPPGAVMPPRDLSLKPTCCAGRRGRLRNGARLLGLR